MMQRKRLFFSIFLVMFIATIMFGLYVPYAGAVGYPFFDDMENTASGNWTCDNPWDYTELFSYSLTHSLTDSPSGNYLNNANVSCRLSSPLNLTTAVRPVLKFWQRYALETDADYGHVEVSKDGGGTWRRLAFVTGQQPEWKQMRIDLAEYAGKSDVMLRFRLTSNASVAYDGWYIDDVEVEEADAVISYPFFDDVENPSVSQGNWLSSSWKIGTPGAGGSAYSWQSVNYDSTWNALTLANVINLTSAQQPQLTFKHKYDCLYTFCYVEVSDNNGQEGTWQRLASYSYAQNNWTQTQIDLSAYVGLPNVRIRFVNNGWSGIWWQIDDIRIEDTPFPHGSIQVTNATMHSAHLSWDQYPWTMDQVSPLFAGFNRYEVYRAKSENVDRYNGELACQISNPLVTECDDTYSVLPGEYYWYRMYVVDTNGMYSTGSNSAQAVYQIPVAGYPFYDNFEGSTGNWEWGSPWGLTTLFSYSPTHSMTDSPGGNYPNNANNALATRINLSAAVRPVLKFWQRYALETDADYGHVEVSKDGGSSWMQLAFVTGQQPEWRQMKIDLAEYAGKSDVMLRFRLTSNASVAYDGWYIDDVEVEEADAAISYPFFDDVENPSVSQGNWLSSSWKIGTPGAGSSTYSWQSTNIDYTWNALTLANVLNLTSAQQPQLTFKHKYNCYYCYVEVSDNNGQEGSWQRLASYVGGQGDWMQTQIDLSAYAGLPNVRVRFVNNGWTGIWWQIDDIRISGIEPTGPAPDIKANGSDGPLFVTTANPVNITASLDPGNKAGTIADWWVGALTPFGTYWYNSSFNWVKSDTPISVGQYSLFDLPSTSLLNMSLPLGFYTFFFVLDDNANRTFDKMTWYDYVNVGVSSGAMEHQMDDLPDFEHIFREKMRKFIGQ